MSVMCYLCCAVNVVVSVLWCLYCVLVLVL